MWNIKDKTVLITGATNGIGKETAIGLAKAGARVIVHGRSLEKTQKTVKEIVDLTGNEKIDMVLGDLSSLSDVKKMAGEIKSNFKKLHVLINNAGGVYMDNEPTVDGFEMTFAVNYLSHFLLTSLLMDTLEKSAPSRIISVSSEAHRMLGRIDLNKLPLPGRHGFEAYSASKICIILFANELAKRLSGTGVTSNALHPGIVRTGFGMNNKNSLLRIAFRIFNRFTLSPQRGALTSLYLAESDEVSDVSGKYFDKCRPVKSSNITYDKELGKKLWNLSERLVKGNL